MFWVINKNKVYSYMVTLGVIGVLFVMAAVVPGEETIETGAKFDNTQNLINEVVENEVIE